MSDDTMSDDTKNETAGEIERLEAETREGPEAAAEGAGRGDVADAAEQVMSTLFDIGRLWAAHGLGVGRSALEASATTLRTTATLLGDLSRKIDRDREAPASEDAA